MIKGPLPPHAQLLGFLSAEEHRALLDHVLGGESEFAPATIISGRDGSANELRPELRVASTWRDLGPLRPMLEQRLMDALPEVRGRIGGGGPIPTSLELELAAHGDGAHFRPHTDTSLGSGRRSIGVDGGDRLISGVYYFHAQPKRFSGGQLRLFRFGLDLAAGEPEPGDYLDLEPIDNSLVVFPSWAAHEVRTVRCPSRRFADYRFALNCWYCGTLEGKVQGSRQ